MLFNSYVFLFLFLPLTLLGYFLLTRQGGRRGVLWLALMSIVFYGWWEPSYLLLLTASIALNYGSARMIARYRAAQELRLCRHVLVFALVANLALLGYFKYADFFMDAINQATGANLLLRQVILPLAISFYTLLQIAFLCDLYQGKVADLDLLNYVLFVTFFPHLIAGPIIHHRELMPQFTALGGVRVDSLTLARGLFVFTIGLFKKVCIADSLAVPVDAGFADAQSLDMVGSWFMALCYQLQIYFDFSGYSDMAIGLALMFGIVFPINFNSPYKACDIAEYWRRWHMTLSRFLRDYVYVALGGNRGGSLRTYRNLFLTFLIGGIWHGAGWSFLIWGAMHGAMMAAQRGWSNAGMRMPRVVGWSLTFLCIMLAFVMFRAPSLDIALTVYRAMLDVDSFSLDAVLRWRIQDSDVAFLQWIKGLDFLQLGFNGGAFVAVCLATCVWARNSNELGRDFRPTLPRALLCGALLVASIVAIEGESPFIYFQF